MGYQVGIKWKYLDTWLWPFTRSDLDQWVPAGLQMMILRVQASEAGEMPSQFYLKVHGAAVDFMPHPTHVSDGLARRD